MGRVATYRSRLCCFNKDQIRLINELVPMAEELTSNYFKISFSQWRKSYYDIQTLVNLRKSEITCEAFAQIIRYLGRPMETSLPSDGFDLYKICLQDHVILQALRREPSLDFSALMLYIMTHELVHIVRFNTFEQRFEVFPREREKEEIKVHSTTYDILKSLKSPEMGPVLNRYKDYRRYGRIGIDRIGDSELKEAPCIEQYRRI